MALLLIAAAVIGLGGFQRIADTQDSVVERAVPALRDAHSVTELNSRVSTIALGMTEVRDENERRAVKASLDLYMQAFAPLMASLNAQGIEDRFLEPLEISVQRLKVILGQRNLQISNRIRLQQRLDRLSESLGNDLVALNQLADSLVANATARTTAVTSSLYDLVEQGAGHGALFDVFDRLVEVDIDAMERTHELRQRSADLYQIVSRVVKEDDVAKIDALNEQASGLLSILNRRVGEITDPQRKQRARALLNAMNVTEGPSDTGSIFAARKSLLALQQKLLVNEREYNSEASRLNTIVNELSATIGSIMTSATAAAQASLSDNRRRFLWTVVAVVLLMALILWRYVHHDVVRRLIGLKEATLAIANGRLDHAVDESGNDEISEMAKVLRLFRDNAQAREQLDAELKRYKDNLEQTVLERTLQLEQTNTRLANEVAQHNIAREKAEQANQAKTDFLATISHELRTPLSGALGTLDLLNQTDLSDLQQRYLHTVNTANTLLLDILDNVLGYSQVRAGKIELHNKNFNLRGLIQDIVSTMKTTADDKEIALEFGVDTALPALLRGDSGKLNQVLMNLVGNAVKFTREGRVKLIVRLQERQGMALTVEFAVRDTGIGIPVDRQDEMFKAFTQVDTSISREYGGVGLGLAICQRLVRLMGGAIEIQSEVDAGTTIRFALPLCEVDAPSQSTSSAPPPSLQGLRVLLVEDDPTMMEITAQYVARLGYSVVRAKDGESALRELTDVRPDVVLLDVSLPGIDGLQVLQRIRESEQAGAGRLAVVAMSAHVFEEEVAAYLAAGMDGFLGKPFTADQLGRAIMDVVAGQAVATGGPQVLNEAVLMDRGVLIEDVDILGAARVGALIDLFGRNGRLYLEQLADLEKSGNTSGIKEVAHRMKSASGNFGFQRLTVLLNQIEHGETVPLREVDRVFYASIAEAEALVDSLTTAQNM